MAAHWPVCTASRQRPLSWPNGTTPEVWCQSYRLTPAASKWLALTAGEQKPAVALADALTTTANGWPSSMISQRPGTMSTASMPATMALSGTPQAMPSDTAAEARREGKAG